MITLKSFNDEKRIVTSIDLFAWVQWPRIFLADMYQAAERLVYRSTNQPLTQFVHAGGRKYPPIVRKWSYDVDAETYDRLKSYSEYSGEPLPTFEQQPDGTYKRVHIGPHWGE
jgi:hypothetical protein